MLRTRTAADHAARRVRAIGWEQVRALEAPLLQMMELGISRALCEMAMIVARADDQKAAHRQAVTEIARVLDGLATS